MTTVEQVRDYLEWHVQNGRGSLPLGVDRRGLGYLKPENTTDVRLALPLEGEGVVSEGKVLLRAVF